MEKPLPDKEVELAPTLEEDWDDAMFSSNTTIESYVAKAVCKEMNLGTKETPKIIKIYEKISNIERKYCIISSREISKHSLGLTKT